MQSARRRHSQAASVTASYLLIASVRNWRNVLREIRWRWTLKVLHIAACVESFNGGRPHSSLDGMTLNQAYFAQLPIRMASLASADDPLTDADLLFR